MMGNQRVLGLHLVFLSMFLVATKYTCLGAQNSTRSCHERERLALLEFKNSVEDDYEVLSSWVGTDCCLWKGVNCDGVTGSVVSLHLRGDYNSYGEEDYRCLAGDKVNAHLAELRHLKHLDLSGNYFQGSRIPEFIGSFKELSYLNLSYSGFIGNIPHHIGNLSNMKVLDLNGNGYTPLLNANDMAWVCGLSSLQHLDLGNVDLSQTKNIDIIPSLTYLSLRSCQLSNAHLGFHLTNSTNIQHLDLGYNSFQGPLPLYFQNMTSMTFLDLSSYDLSLTWKFRNLLNMIPSVLELRLCRCGLHNASFLPTYFNFSAHSNIQYLDLSENSIEGRFPIELMNITSLRVLDLWGNSLNSLIPVMPNLLKLVVSYNNFKHIDLVGIWRQCHLKELSLSYNNFGGEMIGPSSNTSECSQYALEMLDSQYNQLNSSIPESIGKLTNLRVLNLRSNSLTGSIPKAFVRLRSLEVLDLSYNDLTGPIPTFPEKLTTLILSNNQFSGSIPKSLERLRSLEALDFSNNNLTGPIPKFPEKLTILDLSKNQFSGSIPESLGSLASLQTLLVSSNMLNGTILVSILQLSKLVNFDVSYNSLEGMVSEANFANLSMLKVLRTTSNHKLIFNISHDWIPPFQLRDVDLGSCKIANGFPQWLRTQRKLQSLWLSNASLKGLLPTWLRKMPKIQYLDLSHNKLSGSLINLPFSENIELLFIKGNRFNGSIPRSLSRGTNLFLFDVSSNQLSGNIPDCLANLQNMEMFILSSNGLSGVLPSSLRNISSSLKWLKLNDNNFNGELPRDFGNLGSLIVLDLGNNEFSGNIPKWIGKNLTYLMVLRLHKNNFTGTIPLSLCKSSRLHILDIAHNNLIGSIPHCFGELSGMIVDTREGYLEESYGSVDVIQVMKGIQLEYTKNLGLVINMDLSSNKLTGEIPQEVTALVSLVGLNLSHNHLNGIIPDRIGNMKALNSLDFSDNQLTGIIPPSMASLNFLSCMNLSHNYLSGRIPTGNQLQTLTDPSIYAGNRDLCGVPLPNNCSNHEKNPPATTSSNEPKNVWFYLDITCGFATGFWGIIGVLLFKKQWRRKLFMIAEVAMDKVYVAVAVRLKGAK